MYQQRRRTDWRTQRATQRDQELADVWPIWEQHHLRTGDVEALVQALDVRAGHWTRVWRCRRRRIHRHHALADLGSRQRVFDGLYNHLKGG